jgi:hypothetical protein
LLHFQLNEVVDIEAHEAVPDKASHDAVLGVSGLFAAAAPDTDDSRLDESAHLVEASFENAFGVNFVADRIGLQERFQGFEVLVVQTNPLG